MNRKNLAHVFPFLKKILHFSLSWTLLFVIDLSVKQHSRKLNQLTWQKVNYQIIKKQKSLI